MGRRRGNSGIIFGIGALVGAGATIYGLMKKNDIKKAISSCREYTPSDYDDLLDFAGEDYIGHAHNIYCRVVPCIATLISCAGLINILENKDDIEKYISEIAIPELESTDMQTEHAADFIYDTIEQVNSKCLTYLYSSRPANFEMLENNLRSYLKQSDFEGIWKDILILSLTLVSKTNAALCSEFCKIGSMFDIDQNQISSILMDAGLEKQYIKFVPFPFEMFSVYDILDFYDDPIDFDYNLASFPVHLVYCRIIPAIAELASLASGYELLGNESDINKYSVSLQLNYAHLIPIETITPFVTQTIRQISSANETRRASIQNVIRQCLSSFGMQDEAQFLEKAISMTANIKENGWFVFYSVSRFNSQELMYIISRTDYRNVKLDFDGFKKESTTKGAGPDLKKDYLKALGLGPDATLEEVKKAYREMSKKFHPDVISGKDLDEEFIAFATERFRKIQEAFEYLKENMG